jgi:hypothetical protein
VATLLEFSAVKITAETLFFGESTGYRSGNECRNGVSKNLRRLLANPLQSSRSPFSWGSFRSLFAVKEGMMDTPIAALGGWPTVTHEPGLSTAYENREAIFRRVYPVYYTRKKEGN